MDLRLVATDAGRAEAQVIADHWPFDEVPAAIAVGDDPVARLGRIVEGTLAAIKCLVGCAPRAATGASTGCS